MKRREFLKGASLGAAYLAAGDPMRAIAADNGEEAKPSDANAYKYRIAYDIWLNDVRLQPLPMEKWPAPQFDDLTVDSLIRAMDVQSQAGYNLVDLWGLVATRAYPPDIASAFADKERNARVRKVLKAAKDRGLKMTFGFGAYSWGYEAIIANDPSLAGKSQNGAPSADVMCDANPKSFECIKKILDYALSEFDFSGVHLESADLGFCHCPECAGKYGSIGYNTRINVKTADYIKSKWPEKLVYSITLSWQGLKYRFTTDEDKAHVIELSKHIDCIMDQGHAGYHVDTAERQDFIKKLHCAYGTSGKLWLYPSYQWNRDSFFMPYVKRAGAAIKEEYDDGVRGCLYYQGPVNNAGTEVQIAVVGRMLSNTSRTAEDVLGEVIEFYYKPKTPPARKKLIDVFLRAEESYFGNWPRQISSGTIPGPYGAVPGEFFLGPFDTPGPANYLKDPMLDAKGRQNYKNALISIVKELPTIEGNCRDEGRIRNIITSAINTITAINTIAACLGEG
jgi:hypothetical protein